MVSFMLRLCFSCDFLNQMKAFLSFSFPVVMKVLGAAITFKMTRPWYPAAPWSQKWLASTFFAYLSAHKKKQPKNVGESRLKNKCMPDQNFMLRSLQCWLADSQCSAQSYCCALFELFSPMHFHTMPGGRKSHSVWKKLENWRGLFVFCLRNWSMLKPKSELLQRTTKLY